MKKLNLKKVAAADGIGVAEIFFINLNLYATINRSEQKSISNRVQNTPFNVYKTELLKQLV